MKKLVLSYLKDESGQTSTEYILLVAVVAMIVFKFGNEAKSKLNAITGKVFDKADGFIDQIDAN